MFFPVRLAAACACAAAVAVPINAARSEGQGGPGGSPLSGYLAVIDDGCPTYHVALAFPRDEHLKFKNAVKADTGGAYTAAAKEFETNSKIVGAAGACSAAVRKAQENGANTTNLVPAKAFFVQQELALMESAQLRFADDYCKRLAVDWKAQNARLEKLGLDPSARHVRGVVRKLATDIRSRHRHEPALFCLELYGKWSSVGLLKTKQ